MKAKALIQLMRPTQWVKNGFIFLPIFFSGHLFDWEVWKEGFIAFASFCLMASSIYCLNDVRDVEADRLHPHKRTRPVASGAVSVPAAWAMFALLAVGSVCIALLGLNHNAFLTAGIVAGYWVMNIAYCLKLKQVAILDVFIISFGFVLRLLAGGVSECLALSPWIVLMTFLIALFLAFAKRRDDVVMNERGGEVTRRNTKSYNVRFMDAVLSIVAAVTIVCYILYTVSTEVTERLGTDLAYLSSIFVLAGILRYMQITIVEERSGSPTMVVMKDPFVLTCIALWVIFFIVILY